ncbi:aromatic ring-hydroxylating oxygenase subunit alpha [Sphingomonas koreensis]|jgi:3-ketosteroid 9alpha-monooxygenase subunit A|uniref:aromatic ring-hydroxylating oxygenase subunit alpha n=1 Tax=Sphingomonas koreensis TaxID=93064 RepID=UPI0008308598|nr:Rieske 2Fe-2S domain-containing protein [Sphingomonas koreensis]PJI89559.1 phenylpropionate dioxygenase-like ring-hydroxylating dioxygenase large terminal subunit [Sphingomonas koreensis]
MLKLNMKPTGWFQIGWSGEIAPGQAVPLRYFSHDLVAFRSADGRLSVLDAHCKHLGAHLGHGGKVRGDCIICPYHGWAWREDGSNANIPYQDKPTGAKLRKWSAIERHGLIFLWHDPSGEGPRDGWELPDLFADFPEGVANEADYYPCYPQAVVDRPGEHIHPQLMMENTADSVHFVFTHGAPEYPQLTDCRIEGNRLRSTMAFKSPKTGEFALFNRGIKPNVGLSFTFFDGDNVHYRLILTATPIDDETAHFRVSYFLPRDPASPDTMPLKLRDFAAHTAELFEEDARIWRHQIFVQRPVYAQQDIKGYTMLRNWSERFYEGEAGNSPTPFVETL